MSLVKSTNQTEVVDVSNMSIMKEQEMALLDVAITTAKAFPRNMYQFLDEAKSQINSIETAEKTWYHLKRKMKDKKTGDYIEKDIYGPSVRLAEILLNCYGNCRVQARIKDISQTRVIAEAIIYDLQKNIMIGVEVSRRIYGKENEDMINLAAQSALSIAFRNAVFKLIPRNYVDEVLHYAGEFIRNQTKNTSSVSDLIEKVLIAFEKEGRKRSDVLKEVGITDLKKATYEDYEKIQGLYNAKNDLLDSEDLKY